MGNIRYSERILSLIFYQPYLLSYFETTGMQISMIHSSLDVLRDYSNKLQKANRNIDNHVRLLSETYIPNYLSKIQIKSAADVHLLIKIQTIPVG